MPIDTHDAFLNSIKFPRSYAEIRCLCIKLIWHSNAVAFPELIRNITDISTYRFPTAGSSNEFITLVRSTMDSLMNDHHLGLTFHFIGSETAQNAKDIQNRINTRTLEINELLPLLEYKDPRHYRGIVTTAKTVQISMATLQSILLSSSKPCTTASIQRWERTLDNIDLELEEAFNSLGRILSASKTRPIDDL
jgi:hypothetical protein